MFQYPKKEECMENKIEQRIIYGRNAVLETLGSEKEIDTLFVQKGASLGKIVAEAKSAALSLRT